ncbi:MAG: hypothetical protein CMH57_00965 [Myxococcales bacterium]|nr:hypothetical protein [Myxococcales bacterium]
MKFTVLVNDVQELEASQTTTMLIAEAATRGHEVHVASVAHLGLSPADRVIGLGHRVAPADDRAALLAALKAADAEPIDLSACDVLLLRTNPARDAGRGWAHGAALALARFARDHGVAVFNDPDGLQRADSKLYLSNVPARFRPRTLITTDLDAILAFLDTVDGPAVLKPLQGTWGRDVFKIGPGRENIRQIIDVLSRQGYVIAQEFIPEATSGDCRLILLDGQLIEVDGHAAAVQRVPGAGDFRSNIHAGGRATPAVITDAMREVIAAVGPKLRDDGILLAGLDFIGGKLVEINAFATGGFLDAERFTGVRFTPHVLDHIERRAQR